MHHYNYLATARMSAALSQVELAHLLDVRSDTLSKFEHGKRLINFRLALEFEAIFGLPPSALFPDEYAACVEAVIGRAAPLDAATRDKTDEASRKKQALLQRMVSRAPITSPLC